MQITQTRSRATVQTGTSAVPAMLVGLGLTAVATALALLDPAMADSVGNHVREAYPGWGADTVTTERTAILGWLVGTGVLGAVGWLSTIWAVRRRKSWARWLAASWFALALLGAGLTLGTGGAAYDVIVPTPLGLVSALPLVAGGVALVRLWRRRAS